MILRLSFFPIEIKRPVHLRSDNLVEDYTRRWQFGGEHGPIGPISQTFGYMHLNGFRYGVLTYEETWFIKRTMQHTNDLVYLLRFLPVEQDQLYFNATCGSFDRRMMTNGRSTSQLKRSKGFQRETTINMTVGNQRTMSQEGVKGNSRRFSG